MRKVWMHLVYLAVIWLLIACTGSLREDLRRCEKRLNVCGQVIVR